MRAFLDRLAGALPDVLQPDALLEQPRAASRWPCMLAHRLHRGTTVLVGESAHRCHPVGGQGLNLCWRDVAALHRLARRAAQGRLASSRASVPPTAGAAGPTCCSPCWPPICWCGCSRTAIPLLLPLRVLALGVLGSHRWCRRLALRVMTLGPCRLLACRCHHGAMVISSTPQPLPSPAMVRFLRHQLGLSENALRTGHQAVPAGAGPSAGGAVALRPDQPGAVRRGAHLAGPAGLSRLGLSAVDDQRLDRMLLRQPAAPLQGRQFRHEAEAAQLAAGPAPPVRRRRPRCPRWPAGRPRSAPAGRRRGHRCGSRAGRCRIPGCSPRRSPHRGACRACAPARSPRRWRWPGRCRR